MKLRNKRTGECVEVTCILLQRPLFDLHDMNGEISAEGVIPPPMTFDNISDLCDEWEDYKPAEPLIKDEKIRKAVRAWAEANGRQDLLVIKIGGRLEVSDGSPHLIYISFHADEETMNNLNDRTYYTIAELCGEEE